MPELGIMEILTIIGFVVTVIALILAITFFFVGRKKRVLLFDIFSTPLVTDEMASIPGLEVSYCNQPVKNLISTTIEFANIGNQMLEMSSFAAKQPLCLTTSGHFFQGQSVVKVAADNPNSIPSLSEVDEHTQKVVFDFLDPKKSFQLTLLHDGELSVSGDIKNGELMVFDPAPNWLDYTIFGYFIFISVALIVAFLASAFFDENHSYLVFLLLMVLVGVVDALLFSELREKKRQAKKRKL